MGQQKIKVVQGAGLDQSYQTPNAGGSVGSIFTSADPISSTVWAGDSETALSNPVVTWGTPQITPDLGAPQTIWTISPRPADTAGLAPGLYRLQVFATHNGVPNCLFDGLLEIISTAGSAPDGDLCSFTYVETLLARLRLRETEREMLTQLKSECSDAIRKWCGQRDFNRQTYVQEYVPDLNGYCALEQMPVNNVLRVRGYSQTVLTIMAAPSVFQQAWVSFSTVGDWYTNTLTYTGLILNSVGNGILTSTPYLYADYPTVNQLGAAVSSTAGWSSLTQPNTFGLYPSTDLMTNGTSQGALTDQCEIRAYTEDLSWTNLDSATGMFYAGRRRIASAFGQRWGDDFLLLEEAGSGPLGRIQVTYDAGFTIVPLPVQEACAELVKASIERLRTDSLIKEEKNGVYQYQIDQAMVGMLPRAVLQKLAMFRMSRAR